MTNKKDVPLWHKLTLTIQEASELSGIGEKRLRQLVRENTASDFVLMNGTKYLIKRKQFEDLLASINSI